ncbi:uncharacterized protein LOC106052363 isoform X2 [Biomphalaria glabrata]|uniref:Uncharacterized protein LOC106052363 isoform X2 n=1 Tax=Biomphalaria glabrata TaxID=6526 RepID=A0A9W2YS82_BIOGL|nr:uncharacterized protein LOC106052363 isoform X2 [Biomphalaria glabrata]
MMTKIYKCVSAAVFFMSLCVFKTGTDQNNVDPIINKNTSQDAIELKETTAKVNGTVTEENTADPISSKITKQDANYKEESTVDQTEAVTITSDVVVTDVSKQEANGDDANPEDEGPYTSEMTAVVTRNDITIKANVSTERRKKQPPDTITKENNVNNDATTESSAVNEATKAENTKKDVTEAVVPNNVATKEETVRKDGTPHAVATAGTKKTDKKDVVTQPAVVTNATQKTEPRGNVTEQAVPTDGSSIGPSKVTPRPSSPLVNKETLAPPCISKDSGNRRYVLYLNEVRRDITSTTCDIPTYARTTELNLRLCVMNATLSYSITIETENVKYQFSPRMDTCVTCLFSYSDIKVMTFLSIVFAELEGCEQVEKRSCTVKRIDW